VNALNIYDVAAVTDRDISSIARIVWSENGLHSALLINNYPHAILDFQAKRGCCRTGFPEPVGEWAQASKTHEWDDTMQEPFK
jgi:hypothetical protein